MKKVPSYLQPSMKTDKDIILIDMDGVLCNFEKRYISLLDSGIKQHKVWKHPDLYKDLEPMNGAIAAWELLSTKFDTYILSTPPWSSPLAWSQKREWVEKYLGKSAKKKLILCHNKGMIKGKYLIDDRIAHGVADFSGTHIHFGTGNFKDWDAVLSYFNLT
jgi:5'(3')-deoxyribonucleotidase